MRCTSVEDHWRWRFRGTREEAWIDRERDAIERLAGESEIDGEFGGLRFVVFADGWGEGGQCVARGAGFFKRREPDRLEIGRVGQPGMVRRT